MRYLDFINYKKELESISDYNQKSARAVEILTQENLETSIDIGSILLAYINGFSNQVAWHYYLLEASIPYYKNTIKPVWYKRFAYWPGTFVMENYLNHKKFEFRSETVELRFSRNSGSHAILQAGFGKNVPDFHIYLENSNSHNYLVEYKFASYKKFENIQSVFDYYSTGNHLHGAKLLITFLEKEEKFYIIDYENNTINELSISKPNCYIGTDFIDNLQDPLNY